jgi:hypothetical protein
MMADIRIAASVVLMLIVAVDGVALLKAPKRWWRWHSGHTMDGKHITDATWTRPHTKVLHPTGRCHPWHKLPRLTRAAIRNGFQLFVMLMLAGITFVPWLTFILSGALLLGAGIRAGQLGYRQVRRLWPS